MNPVLRDPVDPGTPRTPHSECWEPRGPAEECTDFMGTRERTGSPQPGLLPCSRAALVAGRRCAGMQGCSDGAQGAGGRSASAGRRCVLPVVCLGCRRSPRVGAMQGGEERRDVGGREGGRDAGGRGREEGGWGRGLLQKAQRQLHRLWSCLGPSSVPSRLGAPAAGKGLCCCGVVFLRQGTSFLVRGE